METEKKSQLKTILIIVGAFILCFGIGFYLGKRYLTPKEPEIIDSVETEMDVESPEISSLIPQLLAGGDCSSIEIYANDHKVTVKDLSSDVLYRVTAFGSYQSKGIESMSLEDFDSDIQTYFDTGYLFNPEEISYQGECMPYVYDAETQRFTKQESACGVICGPNSSRYMVARAYIKDDVLKVYVKVLFGSEAESTNFYRDYGREEFVTNDVDNLDTYLYQGKDYIFTFQKVEDQYLFTSSEAM